MAYTYPNTPVLSKIKIGENTYYLKDADVRRILDTFNNAVVTNEIGTVEGNDGKFVTAANIKAYVDSAVAVGIQIVVDDQATGKEEPKTEASASTMGKLYLVALAGTTTGTYTEFITLDKGTSADPRYVWEKIGTTDIDLSGYVTDIKYEGKALSQKKGANGEYENVHTFGDLADADTASASYIPAGSVSLSESTFSATLSTSNYTPVGSVSVLVNDDSIYGMKTSGSVTTGSVATFSEGKFTPNTPTALDLSKFSGGSKASDTFTQGSLPSLGSPTTDSFAVEGIKVAVGTASEESETLIFTAASTASALTAQGTFDAGELPTFSEGAFTPASLASGFYTEGTAASKLADTFDGGAVTQVVLPTFESATFVTGISSASFSGATVSSMIVTGVSYDKPISASFTGTSATITVTPDTSASE